MYKGFCGFLLPLVGDKGCGKRTGCMACASPGFRLVLFCVQIRIKIKIFISITKKQ